MNFAPLKLEKMMNCAYHVFVFVLSVAMCGVCVCVSSPSLIVDTCTCTVYCTFVSDIAFLQYVSASIARMVRLSLKHHGEMCSNIHINNNVSRILGSMVLIATNIGSCPSGLIGLET